MIRTTSGAGAFTRRPAVLSRLLHLGCEGLREHDTQQEARTTDVGDQRVPETFDSLPQPLPDRLHVVEGRVGAQGVENGDSGGAGHRVAAEGGAVVTGPEEVGRGAEGDGRTDREAAAEALGEGHDIGLDALVRLVLEPVAAAADAGLHLVEDEERAGGAGDLPGRLEVAGGGTTTPFSPWIGSMTTRAVSSVTAARSASASPYGTWVTSPGSGRNGVCLAGWPVSAREPMVRPWKPP